MSVWYLQVWYFCFVVLSLFVRELFLRGCIIKHEQHNSSKGHPIIMKLLVVGVGLEVEMFFLVILGYMYPLVTRYFTHKPLLRLNGQRYA